MKKYNSVGVRGSKMYSFSVQKAKNFFGLVEPLKKLWKCKRFQSVSQGLGRPEKNYSPLYYTTFFLICQACENAYIGISFLKPLKMKTLTLAFVSLNLYDENAYIFLFYVNAYIM